MIKTEEQTAKRRLNKDLCRDIAKASIRNLTTITNTLNMLMQPKVSKLFTLITAYVTIVTAMAMVIISLYLALLKRESSLAPEQLLFIPIGAIVFITVAVLVIYYAQHKFKYYSEEMLKEVKPFIEALKSTGRVHIELFRYYIQLANSCYQELCSGKNIDDIETSMICAQLDSIRKLGSDKLSPPFEASWVTKNIAFEE